VERIEDLAPIRDALGEAGALTGQSHHGATISLYGADPSGNEFEVMWMLPREEWGEYEDKGVVMPLDLDAEIARWAV
jgi:catechol-2,3-dioxygenase